MRKTTMTILLLAGLTGCGSTEAPAQTARTTRTPAAATGWVTRVERTTEGGYRMGNPAARIKLVEYGARTCPACRRFSEQATATLKAKYVASGKVSYEFRDYLVHGAPDLAAALVGECAGPAAFFPILEENFARQPQAVSGIQAITAPELGAVRNKPVTATLELLASRGGYLATAQRHGIPLAKAKACIANKRETDRLVKVTDTTPEAVVPGTPSFILNGKRIDGSGWSTVEQALRQAGA